MIMDFRIITALGFSAIILAGCGEQIGGSTALNITFDVTTQQPIQDAHRLYVSFGGESSSANTPSKLVNSRQATGLESRFKFPSSGVLTAAACLPPSLIGFADVHKSEAPKTRKNIELIKAETAQLTIVAPSNGTYTLKEFSQMALPTFSLKIGGEAQEIIALCSLNYTHSPRVDFSSYFESTDGKLVMKTDKLSLFEIGLEEAKTAETEVTLMGIAKNKGKRVGFTASTTLQILSE
jgi:hypothetical protein